MMKAWFTFVVWAGFKRGRVVCMFKGHDWRNEVVCGFPGRPQRPLGLRCHRCASLTAATREDKRQTGSA